MPHVARAAGRPGADARDAVAGDLDMRISPIEAQQICVALKLRGVPAAFVVMPGAGHHSLEATPSTLVAVTQLMLDWFAAHGGNPTPGAARSAD